MLFSQVSWTIAMLLAATATFLGPVNAQPVEDKRWFGGGGGDRGGWNDGEHWWQPSKSSSYLDYGKRGGADGYSSTCNLNNALGAMNLAAAPTPLPAPLPGLSLFQVAIGRGTQNYTCDLANATATPVAVGAVATLFNVSCVAADMPALLQQLPAIALDLPIPSSDDANSPMVQDVTGHHYFLDTTTPFFNLDTDLHQWGMGALKKTNSSNAPAGSVVGQGGQGHGAVAWLKLDIKEADGTWQEVYRLNTAGGNPPTTCTGQLAAFEVQYAAEYWLFT